MNKRFASICFCVEWKQFQVGDSKGIGKIVDSLHQVGKLSTATPPDGNTIVSLVGHWLFAGIVKPGSEAIQNAFSATDFVRKCSFKILASICGQLNVFGKCQGGSLKTLVPEETLIWKSISNCYEIPITYLPNDFEGLKPIVLDLLITALYNENNLMNTKLILNLLEFFAIQESKRNPMVAGLILRFVQEKISSAASWNSLATIEGLKFMTRLTFLSEIILKFSSEIVSFLVYSLISFLDDLVYTNGEISVMKHSIICVKDWLLINNWCNDSTLIEQTLTILVKIIQQFDPNEESFKKGKRFNNSGRSSSLTNSSIG
ncbi:hypothetical protein ROZALSC1DRAFT_25480, partial [Rozella allomycis CSF55]